MANKFSDKEESSNFPGAIAFGSEKIAIAGRNFRGLSAHPNGEDLLLGECSLQSPDVCRVLKYNLRTGALQHYDLPKDYGYWHASFSPSGKYIVMMRVPDPVGNANNLETLQRSEIVTMKSDGTDFRVVSLKPGYKDTPTMSDDDQLIAYWRGTVRPPGSKSLVSRKDIWQINLQTGNDELFTGPFQFFEGGPLQYLPGNQEILTRAWGPAVHAQSMGEYSRRINNSSVYQFKRGQTDLPLPLLAEVEFADYASINSKGGTYFYGVRPTFSLFRKSKQGELTQWAFPRGVAGQDGITEVITLPSARYMLLIYGIPTETFSRSAPKQRRIGMLDMQTSTWLNLIVPAMAGSTPIAVIAR